MRVLKIAKSEYYLRHVSLSVCPSAWNNSAPIGRIFMKFVGFGIQHSWIPKSTNTHLEYVIPNYFPTAAIVARMRLSVTSYVHYLSCSNMAYTSMFPTAVYFITVVNQNFQG